MTVASTTTHTPARGREGVGAALAARLANDAPLLRAVTWPLVRFLPTVVTRRRVLVTRHADVQEVLRRDRDFTVAEVNGTRMARVNGPFILGLDRSPLYERERAVLERCVHHEDRDRIRTTVRANIADLLTEAAAPGRLDVVKELARPAAVRLVADYFGVPGPDPATMAHWMRTIFYETFLNIGDDPVIRRAGEQSGEELHVHLDDLIARRQRELAAGDAVPDDLLTRLVRLQADDDTRLSDEGIRRNVGGVIVGAVDTTSKAVAHAVDELLRRPEALAGARAAALAGDVDAVGRHAFEALRFNPINPVLARHALRDTVLAPGTRRARKVPAGRRVYVGVLPAMFDPRAFPRPGRFDAGRPPDTYLHFGAGLHACFGRAVSTIQIPELVATVVRLDGLRRAGGDLGRIRYDGPFPDRLVVEHDDGRWA